MQMRINSLRDQTLSCLCEESDSERDDLATLVWGCKCGTKSNEHTTMFQASKVGREVSPPPDLYRTFGGSLPHLAGRASLPSVSFSRTTHEGASSGTSASGSFRSLEGSTRTSSPTFFKKCEPNMPAKVGKKPVHYKWDRNTKKTRVRFDSQDVDILPDISKTVTNPGSKYSDQNSAFRGQDLEQLRNKLVLDKLADSTQKVFDNQLQWWTLFCKARGVEPLWRQRSLS